MKKKSGLCKWIPPKGSLELPRENILITNEKDVAIKIRIQVLDKNINSTLEGTDNEQEPISNS